MKYNQTVKKVIAALALMFVADVYAAPPKFTQGTYDGASAQAYDVYTSGSCNGMTQNKLLAIMLSIPVWEIMGGNKTLAPSPMVLSRWDGWSLPKNRPLYSFGTYNGHKRAHWNPGVGLWQLDTWDEILHLNHAERMNTYIGSKAVAERINDAYCNGFWSGGQKHYGDAGVKKALYPNWFACKNNKCWNTFYNDLYNFTNDSINVNLVSGSDWDGGVDEYLCRFSPSGFGFQCYWIDIDNREGYMDVNDLFGNGSRTPLAAPFVSLSTNVKHAIWLQESNIIGADEVVKSVPKNKNGRDVYNWQFNTSLQIGVCQTFLSCTWSSTGVSGL